MIVSSVLLTTVEMLPVFLREAPLLALMCPSDRLQGTDNTQSHTRKKNKYK